MIGKDQLEAAGKVVTETMNGVEPAKADEAMFELFGIDGNAAYEVAKELAAKIIYQEPMMMMGDPKYAEQSPTTRLATQLCVAWLDGLAVGTAAAAGESKPPLKAA